MTNYNTGLLTAPKSSVINKYTWFNYNSARLIETKKLDYKMQDLFEETTTSHISIIDNLELMVNPNGVRAIRLEEVSS